jgi:hypothetical protein
VINYYNAVNCGLLEEELVAAPNRMRWAIHFGVMAGLVPAIHVFFWLKARKKDVDARDKRGHDAGGVIRSH